VIGSTVGRDTCFPDWGSWVIFQVPAIEFQDRTSIRSSLHPTLSKYWRHRFVTHNKSMFYVAMTGIIFIWGRVKVTNGSKTAVKDAIGFLCVSLGSSTVQLHDSLGSRRACACSGAGFSSQNGDSAWSVYYRRTAFCCAFLWAKGLNANDIHKVIFHVYCGKCLSCKAVHNWVEKRHKRFANDEVVETEVRKWLRTQSK
jgi:hypothetical protein